MDGVLVHYVASTHFLYTLVNRDKLGGMKLLVEGNNMIR